MALLTCFDSIRVATERGIRWAEQGSQPALVYFFASMQLKRVISDKIIVDMYQSLKLFFCHLITSSDCDFFVMVLRDYEKSKVNLKSIICKSASNFLCIHTFSMDFGVGRIGIPVGEKGEVVDD